MQVVKASRAVKSMRDQLILAARKLKTDRDRFVDLKAQHDKEIIEERAKVKFITYCLQQKQQQLVEREKSLKKRECELRIDSGQLVCPKKRFLRGVEKSELLCVKKRVRFE